MRRRWVGLGLLLVCIVAAAVYFLPVLGVSKIEVAGAKSADVAAVQEATGIHAGDNMFHLNTTAAARGVSQVPWVEKVTVNRAWPTTVKVEITEHRAVGFLLDNGTPLAVDDHGDIFLSGVQPEGAKKIDKASKDDADAIRAAATALAALPDDVRGQVEKVEAASAEKITLDFPNGRTVYWGSSERASEKAEATRIVLGREGAKWNVSNPAMPTVKG